jgi:Ca2+:H+ antiporter
MSSSAILMAMRNKMDLSLSIALGSSLQIALFVVPVLIFASYLFGRPMNLEFTIPEVVAVIASVLIAQQISSDGESNWAEGVQLLSVYAVLAILFYFLPDIHMSTTDAINSVTPSTRHIIKIFVEKNKCCRMYDSVNNRFKESESI